MTNNQDAKTNQTKADEGLLDAVCSIFWTYGTVTINRTRYDARKNKILRYVEGLYWGEWKSFCDRRKAIKLFIKNGSEDETHNP